MNATRPAVVRTPSESGDFRVRSVEGIHKARATQGFDSEGPTRTGPFAYIYTYLRAFALKSSSSFRYVVSHLVDKI